MKQACSLLTQLALVVVAACVVSCGKDDDNLAPSVDVGEVVADFQKAVRYQDTKQFQTDRDAFTNMMFDIHGIRWAFWRMASNDFENGLGDFFSVPPEDMGRETPTVLKAFYNIVTKAYDNGVAYDKALRNMSDAGMLPPLGDIETRGKASSTLSFSAAVSECCKLSRQSVIAVLKQGGWTTNSQKLSQFYYSLPREDREGYSDPYTFWQDFSQGKLDRRAGQVFVNLYYLQPLEFGIASQELKITPFTNTAIAAHKLATAGQDLVLDCHPSLMAKMLSYGKDTHETVETGLQLLKASTDVISVANNNDSKKFSEALSAFMIQMGHNVATYGPGLVKWSKNTNEVLGGMARENVSLDDLTENAFFDWTSVQEKLFELGSELYDLSTNEALLGNDLVSMLYAEGKKQGLKVGITFKDVGGDKYPMVILTDLKTGEVRVGYAFDSNGNVVMLPGEGGVSKVVTTVNKKTNRVIKKTIIVNENDSTLVECGLDDDDDILEENPKDGELYTRPGTLDYLALGGTLTATIVTNYLYYKAIPDSSWIICRIPSDINQVEVKVASNPTTEPRSGKVTIVATDSKGKVLKTAVLRVTQKGMDPDIADYVSVSQEIMEFDAKGGTQEVEVTMRNGLTSWSAYVEDRWLGWLSADPYQYVEESGLNKGVGHNMVKISASPNTTGEERRGIVFVIASRGDDVYAAKDADQAVYAAVIVKQKGNGSDEPKKGFKMTGVTSVQLSMGRMVKDTKTDGYMNFGESFQFNKGTITQTGSTVHLEFSEAESDDPGSSTRTSSTTTLSFDIVDFTEEAYQNGSGSVTCRVKNLNLSNSKKYEYSNGEYQVFDLNVGINEMLHTPGAWNIGTLCFGSSSNQNASSYYNMGSFSYQVTRKYSGKTAETDRYSWDEARGHIELRVHYSYTIDK